MLQQAMVSEAAPGARRAERGRFSEETAEAFDHSKEGQLMNRCLFFMSLFLMRPYHTFGALQSLLMLKLPDNKNEVIFGWVNYPLLACHGLLFLSGLSRLLSYDLKFILPSTCVVGLAAGLAAMLAMQPVVKDLLMGCHAIGLISALMQGVLDPAQYEFSGLLPSQTGTMAVQAGSGACAVLVSLTQLILRYLISGPGTLDRAHRQTLVTAFLGVVWGGCCVVNIMSIFTYIFFMKHRWAFRVWMDPLEGESSAPPVRQATVQAWRCIWPAALAQTLTYGMSHLVWMYFVFNMMCDQEDAVDWADELAILLFSLGDFVGKAERYSLRWGARRFTSCWSMLVLSFLRSLVFIVLVMATLNQARWIGLMLFLLGATNGWLSTVCFMIAPKALPVGVAVPVIEQASAWLMLGLYLGVSFGTYASFLVVERKWSV